MFLGFVLFFAIISTSQVLIKENINPFLENSIQQNFSIISFSNLTKLNLNQSDVTFLFNYEEITPTLGQNYLNITSNMINKCPNYPMSDVDVFYRNCSVKITNLLQANDSFKFNYLHLYEDQSTNFLNSIEYSYTDYPINPINTTYVFPYSLYSLFTYEECITSMCQNLNITGSINIHDQYNFNIETNGQFGQNFQFLLNKVTLVNYNQNTNQLQYGWDVTNSIVAQNLTYSLPLNHLPDNFDLQISYIIKAEPGVQFDPESVYTLNNYNLVNSRRRCSNNCQTVYQTPPDIKFKHKSEFKLSLDSFFFDNVDIHYNSSYSYIQ